MILIIQIHNIPFHYYEFIKPIEDTVKNIGMPFTSIHYNNITKEHLEKSDKIIISGTSLKDNSFLKDIERFAWIKTYEKPLLGICGGMQLIASVFQEEILKGQEIGLHTITYDNEFLGENKKKEVYELHNYYINTKTFETIARSEKYPQAIKHPQRPIYGVLFHPEVRNKNMIEYFIKNEF